MRVVLDTNIFISALIRRKSPTRRIYEAARQGRVELVTCDLQLEEFRRVTRYPRVQRYVRPAEVGTMLNELHKLSIHVKIGGKVDISSDPADNFLLEMAQAGNADYLATGDKRDLLNIKRHGKTRIVTARQMVKILRL